jgi:hypothetical protein
MEAIFSCETLGYPQATRRYNAQDRKVCSHCCEDLKSNIRGPYHSSGGWSRTSDLSQGRSCGICGGQSGTGGRFSPSIRFPMPILISPTAPHSSHLSSGAGTMADVPSGLSLTPTQQTNKLTRKIASKFSGWPTPNSWKTPGGAHVHRGVQCISRLRGRRNKYWELYDVIYNQRTNVVIIRNDQPLSKAPKMRQLKSEINYFGPANISNCHGCRMKGTSNSFSHFLQVKFKIPWCVVILQYINSEFCVHFNIK